jgi:hypothetical protein
MKPHGTYKLLYRSRGPQSASLGSFAVAGPAGPAGAESLLERCTRSDLRVQRILDSLRSEILEGGEGRSLRIRRVFSRPREIYRLELELPELGYQRTTLLGRDALEELLEADAVRQAVETAGLGQ